MKKIRFGIMGAGKIANKFCDAVSLLEDCEVSAISSKSMERARVFAENNSLPAYYDSYEKMLKNEQLDCVYIAAWPSAHYDLSMLCMDYNMAVLCEKAMFQNSREARTVLERSKNQKVFVMEALWSRFLPALNTAKSWLKEGAIGRPTFIDVGIGFVAPYDKTNRYFNPKLGGGAARDITVYAYELTTYMLEQPIEDMQLDVIWGESEVDVTDHVMLRFPETIASLTTSFVAPMEERMVIYGDNGKIVIPGPHVSKEAFLYSGRDTLVTHFEDTQTENGFVYEILETISCIRAGKIESPIVPHRATIECAELFDKIMETKALR